MKISSDELKAILGRSGPIKDVQRLKAEVPLADQGVDSLDRASIFLCIQDELKVKFTAAEFSRLRTLAEICQALERR